MPSTKGSLNPDLAKQGGGGVEKGKFLVKTAKYQNIKTDYKANQLYLVFGCAVLDDTYNPVREAEDIEIRWSFGTESLKHFRPAVGKDANDQNPTEKTDNPDDEGNTFMIVDGEPVNRSTGVMVLMDSLVKQGFPKATLDLGWAPSFVGMQFELATYTAKECNEKFGTRLNTKPVERTDDKGNKESATITYKVVVKWQNPNYLGQSSTSQAASTGASTAAAAVPASTNESPEELLTKVLKMVTTRKKGSEIKSQQALFGFVTNEYTKHDPKLPAAQLSAVQSLTKDPGAVAKALFNIGLPIELDDDSGEPKPVTYPVAIPA